LEARHSGQGCRNPASRDGKLWTATGVLVSMSMKLWVGKLPESSTCTADWLPSIWPGFRHPCWNDGFSGLPWLVCNDESRSLETSQI